MDFLLEIVSIGFGYILVIASLVIFIFAYRISSVLLIIFYCLIVQTVEEFFEHFQIMVKHPFFTILCLWAVATVIEWLKFTQKPEEKQKAEISRKAAKEEAKRIDDYRRITGQR